MTQIIGAMNLSKEVVLCTFNGSRFVIEQLESILAQSEPVDRISICDDCSSDDSEELVPFVRAIVPDVDLAAGRLVVDPPDGMFE